MKSNTQQVLRWIGLSEGGLPPDRSEVRNSILNAITV